MSRITIGSTSRMTRRLMFVTAAFATLAGCTASQHVASVRDDDAERITVGTVQKEITVGTPATQVAEYLGSPNIVTNDDRHRDTWIYDKISTEVAYSNSAGGIGGLLIGGSGGGFGFGSTGSGATSKTQRTLTVIIHFDEANHVRDFAYHTSRF